MRERSFTVFLIQSGKASISKRRRLSSWINSKRNRADFVMKEGLDFFNLSTEKILSIVEPLMENCLEGSNEGDHEKHVRDFTDRMKKYSDARRTSKAIIW